MKSAKENLLQKQDSEVENIHEFSLTPLDEKAPISKTVVDFTPQISESHNVSITPRLNRSDDCFQPLFESPYNKNLLFVNGAVPQTFLSIKQGPSRTPVSQRSSQSKPEFSKPKPTSKYCQLCKQKFNEDYLDVDLYLIKHIKHTVHLNNLKANPFQKYIQTLSLDFKKKQVCKRSSEVFQILPKEEGISQKPKKKLKQDLLSTKNDRMNIDFSIKNKNSTDSTNNSSAMHEPLEKKNILQTVKE